MAQGYNYSIVTNGRKPKQNPLSAGACLGKNNSKIKDCFH
jgi:hypothetical protein